MYYYHAKLSDT